MRNILVILVVLAATKTEAAYSRPRRRSIIQTDKYIEVNRDQYARMLANYNTQTEKFRENYLERVNATDVTRKCMTDLEDQVNKQLFATLNIKSSFKNITANYEKEIEECGKEFVDHSAKSYAVCVVGVTLKTNKFTSGNRREFKSAMEIAECMMKIFYKISWECHYEFKQL